MSDRTRTEIPLWWLESNFDYYVGADAKRILDSLVKDRGAKSRYQVMRDLVLEEAKRVTDGIEWQPLDLDPVSFKELARKSAALSARRASDNRPPMVYFLQRGEDGPIKIGTSRGVEARIRSLQTSCSERLRLLVVIPGGEERELSLHEQFASLRLGGEWFSDGPELLAFIREQVEACQANS